ncbi:MAG TPA: penicillin acylase family protein [Opitutus sp.]|nr:penicillin acylase family protein [Opitutus sp.]
MSHPPHRPTLGPRLRLLASIVSVLVVVALLAVAWIYRELRASLPLLDGPHQLRGLTASVAVTRDALGVPTIRASTRTDAARALGFLHAQDRFFQMDLLRRRAAGELAELFGKVALPLDRSTRPHHFRELAQTVYARLPSDQRALLDQFAGGVNAGLAALGARPFEYLLLRTKPVPWRPEDSLLVVYAMTLDLQDADDTRELSLMTLRDRYGMDAVNFFAPLISPDDAALDGSTAPLPPIPGPRLINVRQNNTAATSRGTAGSRLSALGSQPFSSELPPGSNAFALSGAHTASGAALLANDPHLNLNVPNIWYRAVLEWPGHRLVGVTLPGLPFVVLGSNGHVAWGLTDAYADTADLVAIEVNMVDPKLYKYPGSDELHHFELRKDVIHVKGGRDETVETRWSHWGPIVATDSRERPLAVHWIADDPAAADLNFVRLEDAHTAAEAVAIAHDSGIPANNFIVADRAGNVAWTIAGRMPLRRGYDGRLPVSWSYGDRYWEGFIPPDQVPTVFAPASGRVWSANQRPVGGDALRLIGDGGFASPPRAAQIRDDLASLEHATPRDLLGIQLDDRSVFLARWHQLLLDTLTPEAVAHDPDRAEFRRLVEQWHGRASTDSISYRLVRAFREQTANLVLLPIFAPCISDQPSFDWHAFHYEPALWTILAQKPSHLLAPEFPTWDELRLAAVDAVIADAHRQHLALDRATWGRRNTAAIHHPFGNILPGFLGRCLNLPADELPGDSNMPRVQTPTFGASMRLDVSPGHEDEGIFEMPGGESGHPLSPFYRAGHEAWVHGQPTPLLPGPAAHTLTLNP